MVVRPVARDAATRHRGARRRRVRRTVDVAQSRAHRDVRASRDGAAATLSDFSYAASGIVLVAAAALARSDSAARHRRALRRSPPPISSRLSSRCARWAPHRGSASGAAVWRRYRAIWSDVAWSLFGVTTWNIQGQALTVPGRGDRRPRRLCADRGRHSCCSARCARRSPRWSTCSAPISWRHLPEGHYRRVTVTLYSVCAIIVLSCARRRRGIWLGWPYLEAHIFGGKFADAAMPLIVDCRGSRRRSI